MNDIFFRACNLRAKAQINQLAPLNLLRICCDAGTIEIITDPLGRDAGYVCWASLSNESADLFQRYGEYPKYFYEYSEGDVCLLLEVFLAYKHYVNVRKIAKDFLRRHRTIIYKKGHSIRSLTEPC